MENKRTTKNLIAKCASLGVSFAATMLITRLVVSHSGNEAYGFYSLSNDFVNVAMIVSIALNSMSSRFITVSYYRDDADTANQYFNSIFYANLMLAAAFLPLIGVVVWNLEKLISIPAGLVEDVKILFGFMLANFLLTIAGAVFSVATFIRNRVDLESVRAIESNLLRLGIIAALYFCFPPRVWYLGVSALAGCAYVFLFNIRYVRRLTPDIRMFQPESFRTDKLREVLKSGLWNCLNRISYILLMGADLLLANEFVSSAAMGLLSVSKTLPKLVLSAMSSFATAFTPGMTIEYAKKDREGLLNAILFSVKICALLSIAVQNVALILGKELYALWVPGQDADKLYILSVVAMSGYLVLMPFECFYSLFTITNKVKTSSLYMFGEALVTITLVLSGIQLIEDEFLKLCVIAGVSSLAEIIRGLFFLPLFGAHCIQRSPGVFYAQLCRILIAQAVSGAGAYAICGLMSGGSWLRLCLKLPVVGGASLLAWFPLVLDGSDRETLFRRFHIMR